MTMVHLGMNNHSVSGLCCMVQLYLAFIAKASADAFGKHNPEIEKWHTKPFTGGNKIKWPKFATL
jgi:hypothetical protein